jgi:predicted AAA+ superfamily ATPase
LITLARTLEQYLLKWSSSSSRKPLLLRGARQVGKSFLVETFAAKHFEHVISINFELSPEFKDCFLNLDPTSICAAISVLQPKPITPGKTLLFLDEIQDAPRAIQSLRYFKEKMPELHVIGAGSLLELTLRNADYRMPVGRTSSLYLHPLSFKEFIHAYNPAALKYITQATLTNPVPQAIHKHLLKQLKHYTLLGGMPEPLAHYKENQDILAVQAIQTDILTTYQNDFGHYEGIAPISHLRTCFNRAPKMIGHQIKYNKIDPELRSKDLKQALSALEAASILHRIHASSAQGLPLDATVNEKKFKLNFIDTGLVKRANKLDAELLLNEDIMLLNQGALAEQFVGQELLACSHNFESPKLYFWARDGSGTAEVDYLFPHKKFIYPIEVKAGAIGKMRSLTQYLKEHDCPFGIRISKTPLSFERDVLSIPLYMTSEIGRLLQA